jgi:hypothetical protein
VVRSVNAVVFLDYFKGIAEKILEKKADCVLAIKAIKAHCASTREIDDKIERETRFYITSPVWLASQLGPAMRSHWAIDPIPPGRSRSASRKEAAVRAGQVCTYMCTIDLTGRSSINAH